MKKVFIILVISLTGFLLLNSSDRLSELTFIKPVINKDSLISLGTPERITNQYILIRETRKNQNKSFFIVDTRENLIYLFDNKGKFITKSPTIDGLDKQNPNKITDALKSWDEHINDVGFKKGNIKSFDEIKKEVNLNHNITLVNYIDVTGRNRVYNHNMVYHYVSNNKIRFFPKGVYKIVNKSRKDYYIGSNDNAYHIETLEGKEISLAIHGHTKGVNTVNQMNYMLKLINSDFNNMKVSKQYKKYITSTNFGLGSHGCITVPDGFLKLSNDIAVNSLVFVLDESETDYIVK